MNARNYLEIYTAKIYVYQWKIVVWKYSCQMLRQIQTHKFPHAFIFLHVQEMFSQMKMNRQTLLPSLFSHFNDACNNFMLS